jgi:hypothetical protein
MYKRFLHKCFITLGLALFLTVMIPFAPGDISVAKASEVGKEKTEDYRLNLKSITLVKGKSFTLKVYNLSENASVTFKSADQEIASTNNDGTITASKVGTTVVTATIKDGASSSSLTCDVTVGPPAISVKWTQSRVILGIDNVDTLRVILKPSNTAEAARFSSYDSSIVTISSGARITAKKYGLTYLFAQIGDETDGSYKFSTCYVIVTSKDNAPLLDTYFNEHPWLNLISEDDLVDVLDTFFNKEFDQTTSASLINSLDRYLNDNFDIKAYKATYEAAQAK